jgi:hypothetical protein
MIANAGADPAGWSVFNTLRQSLANLDLMLAQRNEILETMRTAPSAVKNDIVAMYLGLPRSDGNVDARFPILTQSLPGQVDDGLGLSRVLAEHLAERAKGIAAQFPKKKAPPAARADLGPWEKVFPDMTEYYAMLDTVKGVAGTTAGN